MAEWIGGNRESPGAPREDIYDALVTVIIPLYRSAEFLCRNVDSVLSQTHRNLEVILVDDGSPDDSGAIADDYAARDRRVRVIHQPNGGVSVARNAALDVASGEWVCFIDGDDFVMPDYVEYLLRAAIESGAPVSLTTRIHTVFDARRPLKVPDNGADQIALVTGEDATEMILLRKMPIGPWCKMFKRAFLEEHHIRFIPGMFNGEGFNFGTYAFQRAERVAVGSRQVYAYRRDNPHGGTVERRIEHVNSAMWAADTIIEDLRLDTQRLRRAAWVGRWITAGEMLGKMRSGALVVANPEMYNRLRYITRRDAPKVWQTRVALHYKLMAALCVVSPTFGAMVWHWYTTRKL